MTVDGRVSAFGGKADEAEALPFRKTHQITHRFINDYPHRRLTSGGCHDICQSG